MSANWSITSIQHVGIHVGDLARSIHFYRDLLGFELLAEWTPDAPYLNTLLGYEAPDIHAAVLRPHGSDVLIELVHLRGVNGVPAEAAAAVVGTSHVALAVTNLDELYDDLSSRGVKSVSPPVTPTAGPNQGGRVVNLLDPDGVRIELIQSTRSLADFKPVSSQSTA